MPEGSSRSSQDNTEGGRLWTGLRNLLFGEEHEPTLREEIEEALDEHEDDLARPGNGDLTPLERQMLKNLLHFGERDAGDVGVPRADIIAIPETASFAELVALFAECGHSRLPVYQDSLDTVIGMIHVKDVFAHMASGEPAPDSIDSFVREPLYVPQSMGVLDLLAEMRTKRTHLAIVLDEYSGTEGVITIEDLVEEIVGDIEDEHDEAPEDLIVPLDGGGAWEADARAELEDVAELIDPRLAEAEEDIDTIGGLAVVLAERVPEVGECIAHDSGWTIEIVAADDRRVERVRLHPPKKAIPQDE
ncbi:HlyC/CorC family transporter [Sphingomonas gilva]|uniref:HlyC/CorC family transporter n=1 Tax=Sphingomonas gilva TaxID=2305907 RepID=A0A396RP34_9SPHN|nr:hemolysin family protein [Sphingomonas gilva]RHW18287.1 HlyC/CorC family transporter [Sphingomonas gilva]